MAAHQSFEDCRLEPMRVRIVVLLAHEHDIRPREIREHGLEVSERLGAGVKNALRYVRRVDLSRGRRGEARSSESSGRFEG